RTERGDPPAAHAVAGGVALGEFALEVLQDLRAVPRARLDGHPAPEVVVPLPPAAGRELDPFILSALLVGEPVVGERHRLVVDGDALVGEPVLERADLEQSEPALAL